MVKLGSQLNEKLDLEQKPIVIDDFFYLEPECAKKTTTTQPLVDPSSKLDGKNSLVINDCHYVSDNKPEVIISSNLKKKIAN